MCANIDTPCINPWHQDCLRSTIVKFCQSMVYIDVTWFLVYVIHCFAQQTNVMASPKRRVQLSGIYLFGRRWWDLRRADILIHNTISLVNEKNIHDTLIVADRYLRLMRNKRSRRGSLLSTNRCRHISITSMCSGRLWSTTSNAITLSCGQMYPCIITRTHDDVIKWKRSPRHWPFARGIHRSSVDSTTMGQ